MTKDKNYLDLINKIEKVTKEKKLDLSSGEDLSIGLMNLISIEEHLFFTSQKTNDKKYLTLLNEVRALRTTLMKEIIKDYEGEVWCISKHLLSSSMRLYETGTKYLKLKKQKKAQMLFSNSYKLYNLFWGLNLGLTKGKNIKSKDFEKLDFKSKDSVEEESLGIFSKLGEIIQKAVDCCKE